MSEDKRVDGIDLLKAIAIMMVVTLHIPLWQTDFITHPGFSCLLQYALRLVSEGVPIFVMVNGFLLFRKETFSLKKHIKKMIRILVVFIIWAFILVLIGNLTLGNKMSFSSVLKYVINTQIGSPFTGVLWFLQSLLAIYILFPLLWYIYKEHYKVFEYFFAVVFMFSEALNCVGLLRDFVGTYRNVEVIDSICAAVMRFNIIANLWFTLYFCLGGVLVHYLDVISKHRKKLVVCGLLSWPMAFGFGYLMSIRMGTIYNVAYNYSSPFMLMFLIGLLALVLPYKNHNRPLQRIISSIGINTFGIYLIHYAFILIIARFYTWQAFGERLLVYIVVFIGSYLSSMLLKRIPVIRHIIEI